MILIIKNYLNIYYFQHIFLDKSISYNKIRLFGLNTIKQYVILLKNNYYYKLLDIYQYLILDWINNCFDNFVFL